jgi:hypothetical protein
MIFPCFGVQGEIGIANQIRLMTHPQLLAGFKCESQIENNGRTRSRNMFLSSQHYRGVEGCVGAPGWN